MNEQELVWSKLPPHSLEAETALLGSMLLCGDDKNALGLMRSTIVSQDFYLADHGIIFDAICAIDDAGKPIDAVTVRDRLQVQGLYENIGGDKTLGEMLNKVPTYHHGTHYAKIVRDKSVLRQGIATFSEGLRKCYSPMQDAEQGAMILRDAAEKLFQAATIGTTDDFVRLGDAVDRMLERKENGKAPRLPTGIAGVDSRIGGIPIRKFTLIGGRPGMGKSTVAKQIMLNISASGIPVGIVTIEEEEGKIAENALANFSGITNSKIAYGSFSREDWIEAARAAQRLSGLPFYINDKPAKLRQVEEAITTAVLRHKCRLVVVDYLQLITPDRAGDNANREVTLISKSLKRLAKHLDIALIALCQLNRGNEMGQVRLPRLSDLRESGSLEQDGDLIVLLHREDYYRDENETPDNQIKFIVAKNKDGTEGVLPLHFDGRTQAVSDWHGEPNYPAFAA